MRTETIVVVVASLVLSDTFVKLAERTNHVHPLLALLALVPGVLAIVTDLFLFRLYLRREIRKQKRQFSQLNFQK